MQVTIGFQHYQQICIQQEVMQCNTIHVIRYNALTIKCVEHEHEIIALNKVSLRLFLITTH